jgi:glycosyltransferase involved in cell wall biosynthesis
VPPRNPTSLGAAISEALSLSESERSLFARRAITHVAGRYSHQAMCARTIEVYEELLFPEAGAEGSALVAEEV